jgi:hypothetical protein
MHAAGRSSARLSHGSVETKAETYRIVIHDDSGAEHCGFRLGKAQPEAVQREPAALADDEVVEQLDIEQLASRTWACLDGTAPRGGRRTPGGERPTSLAA